MMPKNRMLCLYVEDDETDRTRFTSWLQEAWQKVTTTPLEIVAVEDIDTAEEELDKGKFDLLVADILFKQRGEKHGEEIKEPLGFRFIARSRSKYPDLPIIALSVGNGGSEQQAREAGADEYLSKHYVMNNDTQLRSMSSGLERALGKHDKVKLFYREVDVDYDKDNLKLTSDVEWVGLDNMKHILGAFLREDLVSAKLFSVADGYSGALVLGASCKLERDGSRIDRDLLVKLDRDKQRLHSELVNKEKVRMFPPSLFAPIESDELVESGGWSAITYRFIRDARDAFEYMQGESDPAALTRTLEACFVDGLGEAYKNERDYRGASESEVRSVSPFIDLIDAHRGAMLMQAIEALKPLMAEADCMAGFNEEILLRFVRSGRVGDVDFEEFEYGSRVSMGHGDLHSKNVLVGRHGQPWLIDPATIGYLPWSADLARFAVDLFLRGLEPGFRSHSWDRFDYWLRDVEAFIGPGDGQDGFTCFSDTLSPVLVWLRSNVSAVAPPGESESRRDWEFLLNVAIEFMRGSYRQTGISTQKRVFCLLAACLVMQAAEKAVNREKETEARGD